MREHQHASARSSPPDRRRSARRARSARSRSAAMRQQGGQGRDRLLRLEVDDQRLLVDEPRARLARPWLANGSALCRIALERSSRDCAHLAARTWPSGSACGSPPRHSRPASTLRTASRTAGSSRSVASSPIFGSAVSRVWPAAPATDWRICRKRSARPWRSSTSRQKFSVCAMQPANSFSVLQERIVRRRRLARRAGGLGQRRDRQRRRVFVRQKRRGAGAADGPAHRVGGGRRDHRLHERPRRHLIEVDQEFRQSRDDGERRFVILAVIERAEVGDGALLEADDVTAARCRRRDLLSICIS